MPIARRIAVAIGSGPRGVRIGALGAGADDLIRTLGGDVAGQPADVAVLRNGRVVRLVVTPRERG